MKTSGTIIAVNTDPEAAIFGGCSLRCSRRPVRGRRGAREALLVAGRASRRDRDPRDVREPRALADRRLVRPHRHFDGDLHLGAAKLALKYSKGRTKFRFNQPIARLYRTALIVAKHDWIRKRDPLAGFGHLLIFYGFVLFIGTAILAFQDDFAGPVLNFHFFEGWFYLGYSLFLDVFGVALIAGLGVMAVRRGILRPFRLDYWRPDRAEGEYDRRPYKVGDWLLRR